MSLRDELISAIANSAIGDALEVFDPGPRGMARMERIEHCVDSQLLPLIQERMNVPTEEQK